MAQPARSKPSWRYSGRTLDAYRHDLWTIFQWAGDATNIEDLGFERGHRTLRIIGKGGQAGAHSARPPHGPWTWPSRSGPRARSCAATTASAWTVARPTAGCVSSASALGWDSSTRTCWEQHSHCGPRRRGPAAGSPARSASRRPEDNQRVRPTVDQLRHARRLRRGVVHHRRLNADQFWRLLAAGKRCSAAL